MVARINSGKSIRGILNYNENKVEKAEARMLMASGFTRDCHQLSFNNKLYRFEYLTRQNMRATTNAMHITLNFSRQDKIDDELLQRIAADYMERVGFGEQPYLVYRHFDASHPHIHIATVNIAEGGQRIETYNIGKNQSEKARKEIEQEYNLIRAEDQQKEMAFILRPAELTGQVYGKTETKAAIASIVREVTGSYKFTSLSELNAALRQFNIWANPGAEGSRMREKEGLTYHLLDDSGKAVGVPIKASSIYGSPTIKFLKSRFASNSIERKPYGQRMKHLIDKAVTNAVNLGQLMANLQQHGIRIVIRENQHGQVYGLTFIDNATRCVFNGSDLGKSYSAKAFVERLDEKGVVISTPSSVPVDTRPMAQSQPSNLPRLPGVTLPVIETLFDIAFDDGYVYYTPDLYRKKKKKRLQSG